MPKTAVGTVKQCPRCSGGKGQHEPTKPAPGIATMSRWENDGYARATDGCKVEPDGRCPHGHDSWLIVLGFI